MQVSTQKHSLDNFGKFLPLVCGLESVVSTLHPDHPFVRDKLANIADEYGLPAGWTQAEAFNIFVNQTGLANSPEDVLGSVGLCLPETKHVKLVAPYIICQQPESHHHHSYYYTGVQ